MLSEVVHLAFCLVILVKTDMAMFSHSHVHVLLIILKISK